MELDRLHAVPVFAGLSEEELLKLADVCAADQRETPGTS
jgi:hypothetical protein